MAENPFKSLKAYQVYRIGSNLHIQQGDWVHCADDAQAIECARDEAPVPSSHGSLAGRETGRAVRAKIPRGMIPVRGEHKIRRDNAFRSDECIRPE